MCVNRTGRQVLLFCVFVLLAILPRQEAIGTSHVILLPPVLFSPNEAVKHGGLEVERGIWMTYYHLNLCHLFLYRVPEKKKQVLFLDLKAVEMTHFCLNFFHHKDTHEHFQA